MANTPKFCPNCGLAVEEGARVCEGCGKKLSGFRSRSALEKAEKTKPVNVKPGWRPVLAVAAALIAITALVAGILLAVFVFRLYDPIARFLTLSQPAATAVPAVFVPPTARPTVPPATATALSPVATALPAPAATQPAPAATPNFQYGGVSFQYGPRIAAGLNAQSLPANPPSDKVAPWDVTPRSVQVDFTGYVLADIFHNPRIMVFPTEEYAKISPQAAQIIETLRQLLANKPERVTDVPFLPFWNAGQVFHTRLAYLDFKNGSGVRFLTEYSQNTPPISNYALFYSFQGLSADGRYYVSAILPVQNPILPDGRSLTQQDYETVNQDYQAYLADIAARLELEPAESFSPNLNDLDALVKSLDVK